MSAMASQITSRTIVYSALYSGADQRKNQSSASLAFVRGIHRWPANFPHKGPVMRKMFPFDGVIIDSVIRGPRTSASTISCKNKIMCVFAFICLTQWHSEMYSFNWKKICATYVMPAGYLVKESPQTSANLKLLLKRFWIIQLAIYIYWHLWLHDTPA